MDTKIANENDWYFKMTPAEEAEIKARGEAYGKHVRALFAKVRADEMTAEECAKQLFEEEINSEEERGIVSTETPRQRLFGLLQFMGYFVEAHKLKPLLIKAGIPVED